jgi:CBS domain-containing protein
MTATESKAKSLTLKGRTAADLMTEHVVSITEDAPLHEAIAVLTDRGFSGAPVINEAGRPVGVISQSDILVHDRNVPVYAKRLPE